MKLVASFTVPGKPVPKARARIVKRNIKGVTRSVGITPDETVAYENLVKMAASIAMRGGAPVCVPIALHCVQYFPIPESWSGRRKKLAAEGRILPTGKPDVLNVVKSIEDGMNKIVYNDDAQIVLVATEKKYGDTPRAEVAVYEMAPDDDLLWASVDRFFDQVAGNPA